VKNNVLSELWILLICLTGFDAILFYAFAIPICLPTSIYMQQTKKPEAHTSGIRQKKAAHQTAFNKLK